MKLIGNWTDEVVNVIVVSSCNEEVQTNKHLRHTKEIKMRLESMYI